MSCSRTVFVRTVSYFCKKNVSENNNIADLHSTLKAVAPDKDEEIKCLLIIV